MRRSGYSVFLCLVGGLCFAPALLGQLPATRLDGVFPAGGAPGQTVEMTIVGTDLDDVTKLAFSHPGITAVQKMLDPGPFDSGPQPAENRFVVTIKPDVPPGQHAVRCEGKYGLSNMRTFVVDPLPASLEVEPNNDVEKATEVPIPTTVDGQFATAADLDWYRFQGQAGQRIVIDGLGRRLDSRTDLRVTLAAADGRILAESRAGRLGEPGLDVTLPAAGVYFVKARDALHAGGGDYVYRLRIGSLPIVESVFPPAGLPGSNEEYTVYGYNLPGGQASGITLDGRVLEQLKTRIAIPADIVGRLQFSERLDPHQFSLDGIEYRAASPAGPSNAALVTVATAPIVREQADNNTPATAQKLAIPCEVAGQFYPRRDQDWYTFDCKAGDTFWIDVISHRLGLPTDPSLVIQRVAKTEAGMEQVTPIASVDDVDVRLGDREFDQRSFDPVYKFVAPADGTYRVLVRESYSQLHDDPRLVYRLAVRPASADFRLVAVPVDTSGAVLMRKGGRESIRVIAQRRDGFEGEITLTATGLPQGVTMTPVVMGPASSMATLVLTADPGAAVGNAFIQVVGKAVLNGGEVTRTARAGYALDALQFAQPNSGQPSSRARLVDSIPLTVSPETARVTLTLGDGKLIETARGGVIKVPYTVARQDGAAGAITGFPIGVPPNVGLPQVAIGGNAAGELELRLTSTTPPGTYSFHLAGMVQGVNYSRNPEGAAKAKERQDAFVKILADVQTKAQQAQTAAQQAATAVTQAANEQATALAARAAAEQAMTAAANVLKAAGEALAKAKADSAAKPDDAQLKALVVAAQKAVDDATEKAKVATEAAVTAKKKHEESIEKSKLATEAKSKADMQQQAAQQQLQLATQEKQRIDQRAQLLAQQATLRGFNVNVPSTPVTVKIADFPIKFSGPPEKLSVKQGMMAEFPLKVERLFGFNTDVAVQLILPGGVGGLEIPQVNVPGNVADGKFVIKAQPAATPGVHALIVRVSMAFNGQPLTFDQPLALTVEKVETK